MRLSSIQLTLELLETYPGNSVEAIFCLGDHWAEYSDQASKAALLEIWFSFGNDLENTCLCLAGLSLTSSTEPRLYAILLLTQALAMVKM